jgi:hypothetical protein
MNVSLPNNNLNDFHYLIFISPNDEKKMKEGKKCVLVVCAFEKKKCP